MLGEREQSQKIWCGKDSIQRCSGAVKGIFNASHQAAAERHQGMRVSEVVLDLNRRAEGHQCRIKAAGQLLFEQNFASMPLRLLTKTTDGQIDLAVIEQGMQILTLGVAGNQTDTRCDYP